MEPKFAFAFLVLGFFRSENCGNEKVSECLYTYARAQSNHSEENFEEPCRVMKESTQCIDDVADECYRRPENRELFVFEEWFRELKQRMAELCPRNYIYIPNEFENCIANLKEELTECDSESIAEAVPNIIQLSGDDQEPDKTETKCSMHKAFTKCVAKKVKDGCGDQAAKFMLREMADVAVRKNCPNVEKSIQGLIYDGDKRDEFEKCVANLKDELTECVTDSIAEAIPNIIQLSGDDQEPDETEIKCSMHKAFNKCVMKKVQDGCGDEAVHFMLIELADEDIEENCSLPYAGESIKGLMNDSDIPALFEGCAAYLKDELTKCVNDSIAEAIPNIIQLSGDDQEPDETEIKCWMHKAFTKCLAKKVQDGCGDEAFDFVLIELTDEDIKKNCPLPYAGESIQGPMHDSDIPAEFEKCVANLKDELTECVSESIAEAVPNIIQLSDDQEPDETEIKCSMHKAFTKCVAKKVKDGCGDEAVQFLAEMADEDIKRNCPLPNAGESIQGYMHDRDIPDEFGNCVANLKDELTECVKESIAEAVPNIIQLSGDDQEPDETEIKCSMHKTFTKCVAKKFEDGCGDEAAQFMLAEMADEDIKKNCPLPNAG